MFGPSSTNLGLELAKVEEGWLAGMVHFGGTFNQV